MCITYLVYLLFVSFESYACITEKSTTQDMWTPYKELQSLVERYITPSPTTPYLHYLEFTEALRNHRQNFLTLLKNPVSSRVTSDRLYYVQR